MKRIRALPITLPTRCSKQGRNASRSRDIVPPYQGIINFRQTLKPVLGVNIDRVRIITACSAIVVFLHKIIK